MNTNTNNTDKPTPIRKLTAKQDKFARLVAEGMTQADAYREAYNTANMKPVSIYRKATELMANGMVTARVDTYKKAINEELDKKYGIHREFLINELIQCLESAKKGDEIISSINNERVSSLKVDRQSWLKAVDQLTKMAGEYAPTKSEIKTQAKVKLLKEIPANLLPTPDINE